MKKIALFLLGFCLILSSCKNRNRYEINYDGPATIDIVLLEELGLNVTSDYPLTYYSDNELVVTVSENGVILGKNVGEANVVISNAESTLTLKVVVSLFEEPSFDFYCNQAHIMDLYGMPYHTLGDSIYTYGGDDRWYSFAVWRMDFMFVDNQYIESVLYLRNSVDTRINEYLEDNYYYQGIINDTIDEVVYQYEIYLNNPDYKNASMMVSKLEDAGYYEDICLFYLPYEYTDEASAKEMLKRSRKRK